MEVKNGLEITLTRQEKDSLIHTWHILNHIDTLIDHYLGDDDNRSAITKLTLEYSDESGGGFEEWNEDIFGIINPIEALAGCERIYYGRTESTD